MTDKSQALSDWSFQIVGKPSPAGDAVAVSVVVVSLAGDKVEQNYIVDSFAALKDAIRATVTRHDVRKANPDEFPTGQMFDLTPDPTVDPPPPSDEEKAKAAFFVAFAQWKEAAQYEPIGFDASALRDAAAQLFKPDYVGG